MYAVGVCCYADPEGMRRLLESTKEFFGVICVVCRWEDFEYNNGKNDEMIKVIKSYKNTILIQADGLPQFMARNLYLQCAGVMGFDALLILDSDEVLKEMNWYIPKETNAYNVKWNDIVLPRVIVNPKECRYKDRHNQVWYKGFELFGRDTGHIEGIAIVSDKSFREPERERYQREYNLSHPTQ